MMNLCRELVLHSGTLCATSFAGICCKSFFMTSSWTNWAKVDIFNLGGAIWSSSTSKIIGGARSSSKEREKDKAGD